MIFYAVLIAVILIATAALFGGTPGEKIMYSDIDKMFYEQQVKAFEIGECCGHHGKNHLLRVRFHRDDRL